MASAARVGVFGFSRGGHTALALAGGVADFSLPFPMCADAPQMPMCAQLRSHDLPVPPDFRLVPRAGHFAFLAPCPAALAAQEPVVCGDANGFDRLAFHTEFNAQVLGFFQSKLP